MSKRLNPRWPSATGSARKRRVARASSSVVRATPLVSTQARTTKADMVLSRLAPVGCFRLAKLKRWLAAPPVKTQPYALPPCRMPTTPTPRGGRRTQPEATNETVDGPLQEQDGIVDGHDADHYCSITSDVGFTMTEEKRVESFLRTHTGLFFCAACLAQELGLNAFQG